MSKVAEKRAESATFSALWERAHEAGHAAATGTTPRTMIVGEAMSLFGPGQNVIDTSKPVYIEPEGACGFAWVRFSGKTPFGRWAKSTGRARKAWDVGLEYWVSAYNQSVTRKEAYATAFAKVLREGGVDAYSDSRLD